MQRGPGSQQQAYLKDLVETTCTSEHRLSQVRELSALLLPPLVNVLVAL